MPTLLREEITKNTKPLILIFTNNTVLQQSALTLFQDRCSLLFLSDTPPTTNERQGIYHMQTSDAPLLAKLEESIDYSIILLSDQSEKKALESVFEKINSDSSKTVLAIPAREYKDYNDVLFGLKENSNIIPAFYGDILHKDSNSQLLKFIQNIVSNRKATLSGNDLTPVFPISPTDLITTINYLLFSRKRPNSLFLLFYKTPETLLSAVHLLARIDPEISLEINHEHPLERFEERGHLLQFISDQLQLNPMYLDSHMKGFEHAIQHIQKDTSPPLGKKHMKKNGKMRRFHLPKAPIYFLSFSPSVPLALTLSLFLFLFINAVTGVMGIVFLRSSIQAFEKKDFLEAKEKGVFAQTLLSVPHPTLSLAESTLSYIPLFKPAYNTLHLINMTTQLTTTSSDILERVGGNQINIDLKTFEGIIADSQYLYHEGARFLLSNENRALSNMLTPQTTKILSLLPILPTVLGYDEQKEYLLLFQNNAELRPNGGFIGSIGKLTIDHGKIKDLTIQDVYEADGQLTVHVEPHYIIRRYLQPHLYLRDSNFDLNFQKSASQAAQLYRLETRSIPDGVVALDFTVAKRLLEIIGPIRLDSYDTTITADNSFDFLQKTIDDNFFPGSTQKKEVLEDLWTSIMLKLEKNPDLLVRFGFTLPDLFEEKHIQISYPKESIQSLFSSLGFGGTIPKVDTSNENTIYDIIGFNEANIGVNKANKNIARSISYEADLATRRSVAKITLRNEGQSAYKVYLRLITPEKSVLSQILIDGRIQKTISAITDPKIYEARNFTPDPTVLEVDTAEEYGKTIFGTVISIPEGKTQTIQFVYSNPHLLLESSKDSYSLTVIKQPGTLTTPLEVTAKFEKGYEAEGESIESFGDGSVRLSDHLTTDKTFNLKFKKE